MLDIITTSDAAALSRLSPEQRDARIVALCDRAISGLQDARDLEEVMAIRNAAEAFSLYTRKMKAAVEAKNECELVVLLAEARIGAELAKAQERGEVATRADGTAIRDHVHGADKVATLSDIGIPRQRASEMKKLAEAGEERIREEVATANKEGRRPSRAKLIAPRPTYRPDYLDRPAEHAQFLLWLRAGAELCPRLGDGSAFRRALAAGGDHVPPAQVAAVLDFLTSFEGDE